MVSSKVMGQIRDYVDYCLGHSTAQEPFWNMEKVRTGKPNKWNYIDGCMINAVLSLYEMTRKPEYLDFADRFIGWFVQDDGSIRTYDPACCNLDDINEARTLFPLWSYTGKEKYRRAMETIRHQLDIQPRTNEGNFWHKKIYPNQVWLDGLHMAQPFYMQYETQLNHMRGCRDVIDQFRNVERLMKDPKTGLYYHGYDESRQMYWADPRTGCSPNFWTRSIGWFAAALVETASVMDESLYYEYRYLQKLLLDLSESLLPFQAQDGMFYQLTSLPDAEGNYLETSGTALIAFAWMKGVRLGYLPERFYAAAEKAFNGICSRYLSAKEDGSLELGGICLVAGLGGRQHRDGSVQYYLSEPVVANDAKGVAPLVMAYTELLRRKTEREPAVLAG